MSSTINQKYTKNFTESQSFGTRIDPLNGYLMCGKPISKELLLEFFLYLEPKELLTCSEVCDNWNKIIKTTVVWKKKYVQKYDKTPKNWPWYVLYSMITTDYYDQNLIKNANGEDNLRCWDDSYCSGKNFKNCMSSCGFLSLKNLNITSTNIYEDSDTSLMDELRKIKSCFQAVQVPCSKYQFIDFTKNKLFHAIINTFKPTIYISEWRASTFPLSSSTYTLEINLLKTGNFIHEKHQAERDIYRFHDTQWKKEVLEINNYQDVDYMIYKHSVTPAFKNFPFRATNLVSITGSTAMLLSDTIPEVKEEEEGEFVNIK